MKKSPIKKKLELHRSTVSHLNKGEMAHLLGGYTDGSCIQDCLDPGTGNTDYGSWCMCPTTDCTHYC